MKNIFRFLMAVAVLFTASCAKEDISSSIGGGEVEMTFTVDLPELGTRAYGDGTKATTLHYYVYDSSNNELSDLNGTADRVNDQFKFNLPLLKGMTYSIVFWADCGTGSIYSYNPTTKTITANYNGVLSNNENLDAFYKCVTNIDPTASNIQEKTTVVLTRPFAQLNTLTKDYAAITNNEVELKKSKIVGVIPTTLNVLDGTIVTPTEEVTLVFNDLPKDEDLTDDLTPLSMNYILAPATQKFVADITFYYEGSINFPSATYTNIPLQRNYRTNIIGKLLTASTEFTVTINPVFNEPAEEVVSVNVSTASELMDALNNANVAEIVLTTDLTLDGTLTFGAPAATRTAEALPGRSFVIDGNGNTLKVVKAGTGRVIDFTSATNGASLTLKNLTIENNVSFIERIVNYNTSGTLTLDNVKIINAEGCTLNYAINLPASSDESTVVINNSEIWANAIALNLWGEKTTVNITNSKLYVVDSNAVEGYTVISLNNGGENAAHNSVINIEGGEVKVIYEGEGETKPSSALRDATNDSVINISESTVVVGEMKLPVANVLYEGYDQFYSFTTLGEAIAKAQEDNNGTVCLIKDITLSETINIAADDFQVVIDLNGKTINAAYVEGSETNHIYAFENHGKIKIIGNGTINARGIFNYGALTLENGTINAIDGNGGYAIRNYKDAIFTMNGGTIATTLEDDNQVDKGGYDATTLRVDEGATAVINGGTITNICDYTFAVENHGVTTVKGGTFTSVHTNTANYGTLTINGGSFTCNGLDGITAHALWADAGTTTINGGTFDGKDNYNGFNVDASAGAKVYITGGEFLPVHSGSLYGKGSIVVSGGKFFDKIENSRLDDGYELEQEQEGGYWVVNFIPAAKIGETTYNTLQEAIEAVQNGETIIVNRNATFNEGNRMSSGGTWYEGVYYIGDKSFTIDLNNNTISQNGAVNDYMFLFKNDGEKANTITFKNGTIDAGTAAYCALCTSTTSTQKITINLDNVNLVGNNSNGAVAKIRGGAELNVNAGTVITGIDSYVGIEAYGNNTVVNINEGAKIYQNGTSSYAGSLAGASGGATLNVLGGEGVSAKGGFIVMTSGGTVNISGGNWTANTDGTYANSNKSVLISQSANGAKCTVNVTGGTFKGGYNCYGNAVGDATINIYGGNFNANPSAYVAAGKATENNGVWTVE